MDQPYTRERFWSAEKASFLRTGEGKARRLKTRACPRLADAIVTTTHPDLFEPGQEAPAFARLKAKARMTRYGGDCYGYCLLAAGFVDIVVESGLKPYDVVALIPIIERAGRARHHLEGRAGDGRRPHPCHGRRAPARGSAGDAGALTPAQATLVSTPRYASNAAQKRVRTLSVSCRISWRAPGMRMQDATLAPTAKSSMARVDTTVSLPAANSSSGTLILAG